MDKLSLFTSCRTKSCGASDVEFFLHPLHACDKIPSVFCRHRLVLRWGKKLNGKITKIQNKDTTEVFL